MPGNAEPCDGCKRLLLDFGLAYALHTDDVSEAAPDGVRLMYFNAQKGRELRWD